MGSGSRVAVAALLLAACASDSEESKGPSKATPTVQEEPEFSDSIVVTGVRSESAAARAYAPMPPPGGYYEQPADTSRFDNGEPSGILRVADAPVSTFSADVDTASYSIVRRFLNQQALPPSEAVRIEEMINAFDYDYSAPKSADEPFAADVSVFGTPWNEKTELIRIGVRGYDLEPEEVPDSNVVLLLDVSGSMNAPDKLPLLKESMKLLAGELGEDDTLAVVVYAGAAGVVLEPTGGNEKLAIREALDRLSAGGSTAGGEGIELAYDLAEQNLRKDAVNRVILATDGDFNVGVTSDERLEDLVARKRETGIYLSVLGFGAGNLNDTMMQRIAQNGNGVAAYIDDLAEARRVLVREFTSSMFPIAEDLKFQVEFNPSAVSEYRLIGYETRALREEDFDNDRIDAGDIGSGHTVTALYEVTRAGEAGSLPDRRYDEKDAAPYDPDAELAFLKIRYKRPGEDDSRLITRPITPADRTDAPSEDARFAAAVAALGEKLGRSGRADGLSYDALIEMANGAKGRDEYGDRAGFVQLVRIAESLDRPGEGD